MEEKTEPRRRGRIPKSPVEPGKNLTQAEISQRYRDRKKASGLELTSFWIPQEFVTRIREMAEKEGESTSDVVERILRKALK